MDSNVGHYAIGNAAGGDSITGCAGNDTLSDSGSAGEKADTLHGIGGNDTFIIYNTNDIMIETSTTTINTVESVANCTIGSNIEVLTLIDPNKGHYVVGNSAGGDIITGCAGNDTLSDNSNIGTGVTLADTLTGIGGNDTFIVYNTSDIITENAGSAGTVLTYINFTLIDNIENLTSKAKTGLNLFGDSIGGDSITGCYGSDTINDNNAAAADTLAGVGGNDTFIVTNSGDVVSEMKSSKATIIMSWTDFSLVSNVQNLTIMDSSVGHYAIGNAAGGDSITGCAGNDTLSDSGSAGEKADTLHGIGGNDTFIIYNTNDIMIETSTTTINTVESVANCTIGSNIEILTLIDPNKGHYVVGNSAGGDIITGCAGNDTLSNNSNIGTGVTVADTLTGIGGNDTFIVYNTNDVITENTGSTGTVLAYVNFTLVDNCENLTSKTRTGLDLFGDSIGGDSITGCYGSDTIDDNNAAAADTLAGVGGNDTFLVYNTDDIVTEAKKGIGNIIYTYTDFSLVNNISNMICLDTIGHFLTGNNAGGDSIEGSASGGDTLSDSGATGAKADTLQGIGGNDTFIVYNTGDNLIETSTTTINTVESYANYTIGSNIEVLK